MASTNKTTNFELSQFIGSDKPAWLSDYNSDMSKIDTAMKNNQTAAAAASGAATTAQGTADGAATAASNAATAASAAQETANTAIANAASAQSDINTLATSLETFENKFDLTTFKTPTALYNRGEVTYNGVASAHNTDGSMGKVYGYITTRCTNPGSSGTIALGDTGLRPTSNITINGLITAQINATGAIYPVSLTINTDGTAEIPVWSLAANDTVMFIISPCLLFAKDFGDTPIPQN